MEKIILIDGHGILHRAYHALPPLETTTGELVNAVYGFTSILLNVLSKLRPNYVVVAFDKKGPTFRHKEFEEYKAHRPKMDEELVGQIARVKEVVETMRIPYFAKQEFEADDLIGTLAKRASKKNLEVVVVSSDKDLLQLISDSVKVYFPRRGRRNAEVFDLQKFREEYGFEKKYFVDYKALIGDPSDGLPGVKGVGPKTATKLIKRFGNLESIYQNIKEIEGRARKCLGKYQEEAFMSKNLAEIVRDVPLDWQLEDSRLKEYSKQEVIDLFEELEFSSLIPKLPSNQWEEDALGILMGQKEEKKEEAEKDDNEQIEMF
jgi:DNA polymerase-1